MGDRRCIQAWPVQDEIVEGDEIMTFRATALNVLDMFVNEEDSISFTLFDDDGEAMS